MTPDAVATAHELLKQSTATRDALLSLRDQLADAMGSSFGEPAVTVHFDNQGVLDSLTIDRDTRNHLTEDQLLEQVSRALINGPTPRRNSAIVESASEKLAAVTSQDYSDGTCPLTLTALAGKPVRVRTRRPGWLLGQTSEELSDHIVSFARRAAADAEVYWQ